MMEYLCCKPRYEAYWYGRNKNVVTQTPGFGDVMNRGTYLKIVDEEDPNLDKTDKIDKVRPMLNLLMPRFRHFF